MRNLAYLASSPLWWQHQEANERAKALLALLNALKPVQEQRKTRFLELLRLYEARNLATLTPSAYMSAGTQSTTWMRQKVPLARALVATVTAKIAGKQKPKAM